MAAESDGLFGMVSDSGDEKPMDLSRASRKSTRLMPPLIPISLLRASYNHRRISESTSQEITDVSNEIDETVTERLQRNEIDNDWKESYIHPKRCRLEFEESWLRTPRLDRSRSVPQLTPLPSLQRYKSLSESRIPTIAAESETNANTCEEVLSVWGFDSPNEHLSEEDLRQKVLLSENNDAFLKSSWIYIGYYSQLLHRFQAQELLRRFAVQHQRDSEDEKIDVSVTSKAPNSSDDSCDIKRRQTRPLTGKHVRPGTGASPATLLSLRRKIQARQQQHDAQQLQK